MKKYKSQMKPLIEKEILTFLETKKKALREELFNPAIQKVFEPSKNELREKNSQDYMDAKSITGIIINEMISLNTIYYDGEYIAINNPKEAVDKKEILDYFYNKYLTSEEIKQSNLEQKNLIKSIVYNNISKNPNDTRTKIIEKIQNEIDKSDKIKERLFSYPAGPIGNLLREHKYYYLDYKNKKLSETEYIKTVKSSISKLFGQAEELFESFVFRLIREVYKGQVKSEKLTAGSMDNGIDCEFLIEDPCGFKERIIVQAKTKKQEGKNLSLKVLREYVGVLELTKADKCLIISNQNFNKTAQSAASGYNRVLLVGIDDLYKLMLKTSCGLIIENSIARINDEVFLIDKK